MPETMAKVREDDGLDPLRAQGVEAIVPINDHDPADGQAATYSDRCC